MVLMPRFTIGSIATGVALFVIVLAVWATYSQRQAAAVVRANTTSADGRHAVVNVDPARGTVVLDGPNDLELTDSDDWDGCLTAGTW
jgi:hypothetical protein